MASAAQRARRQAPASWSRPSTIRPSMLRKEGRDGRAPFRRLVIPHEGGLPDIHSQQGLDPGGHPRLTGRGCSMAPTSGSIPQATTSRARTTPWATGPRRSTRSGGRYAGQGPAGRYLRQREYPQPPPPSTNSTTSTINKVSMAHHLPPRSSPDGVDSFVLAGSSASASLPPLYGRVGTLPSGPSSNRRPPPRLLDTVPGGSECVD
jgi:hypothetical protein